MTFVPNYFVKSVIINSGFMDIVVKSNYLPGYPCGAVDISTARQDCQFKLCSIFSDQEINYLLQACQSARNS